MNPYKTFNNTIGFRKLKQLREYGEYGALGNMVRTFLGFKYNLIVSNIGHELLNKLRKALIRS